MAVGGVPFRCRMTGTRTRGFRLLSRRALLRGAGGLLAAGLWPGARAQTPSPVMLKLSAYMSAAAERALPAEVLEQAQWHTLDTVAAMVSGSQLKPGRFAIEFARQQGGEALASVVASNVVCNPLDAAFANAMLAQADETDDSHAPSQSHPGCSIVPAAWAAAERFGIGGPQLLRAIVLGYDVGARVTMAVGRGGFQTANHMATHSVANCFGAAAAAACVARLSAQQMRWTLDYAAQQASGIKVWQRDTEHIEKAFLFGGVAARAGITAAWLVHAGATGVDDVFAGADNFLGVFGSDADAPKLVEALGERYEGAHQHQEVDGGLAHPGAARCHRAPTPAASSHGRTGARAGGARGPERGRAGG
jgi:2-methylcitrate dehydratase PrpD